MAELFLKMSRSFIYEGDIDFYILKLTIIWKRVYGMIKSFFEKLLSKNDLIENSSRNSTLQKIYLFEANSRELEQVIESSFPEGSASGYVYFVQEHMNGTFKIGKTKNIERRMNVFNVKLPFKNELIFLVKSGNHHQTEVAFHKYFASKRLEGEWFALNKEDVEWIRAGRYTADIQKTIEDKKVIEQQVMTDAKGLTDKQLNYAKTILEKIAKEYELLIDITELSQEDLNRLSAYYRYKNVGAAKNLVKLGVLREK